MFRPIDRPFSGAIQQYYKGQARFVEVYINITRQ
jgi:hypothetical protein